MPRPRTWRAIINRPQTEKELAALRHCIQRGRPYGDSDWVAATANTLGIETTLRPRGRTKQSASRGK